MHFACVEYVKILTRFVPGTKLYSRFHILRYKVDSTRGMAWTDNLTHHWHECMKLSTVNWLCYYDS